MLLLVVPTAAAAGIHFVTAVACMCPAASGTVVSDEVVVPPDIHCSPAVGEATDVVVDVVATVSASDSGAVIVAVSVADVFAGGVSVGVAMLSALYDAASSTMLVCPVQT